VPCGLSDLSRVYPMKIWVSPTQIMIYSWVVICEMAKLLNIIPIGKVYSRYLYRKWGLDSVQ
jgi:hypothetical protein